MKKSMLIVGVMVGLGTISPSVWGAEEQPTQQEQSAQQESLYNRLKEGASSAAKTFKKSFGLGEAELQDIKKIDTKRVQNRYRVHFTKEGKAIANSKPYGHTLARETIAKPYEGSLYSTRGGFKVPAGTTAPGTEKEEARFQFTGGHGMNEPYYIHEGTWVPNADLSSEPDEFLHHWTKAKDIRPMMKQSIENIPIIYEEGYGKGHDEGLTKGFNFGHEYGEKKGRHEGTWEGTRKTLLTGAGVVALAGLAYGTYWAYNQWTSKTADHVMKTLKRADNDLKRDIEKHGYKSTESNNKKRLTADETKDLTAVRTALKVAIEKLAPATSAGKTK
jgi:hypothetical protein